MALIKRGIDSASDRRMTPRYILRAVASALGPLILDPYTDYATQDAWRGVDATVSFLGHGIDGHTTGWGTLPVFLNPPFSRGNLGKCVAALETALDFGTPAAILLLPLTPSAAVYMALDNMHLTALVLPSSRVPFGTPGVLGPPRQGLPIAIGLLCYGSVKLAQLAPIGHILYSNPPKIPSQFREVIK